MLIPLVLYGALAAPSHMAQRRQSTEPDQLREAARIISSHASPGDAIVYLPPTGGLSPRHTRTLFNNSGM